MHPFIASCWGFFGPPLRESVRNFLRDGAAEFIVSSFCRAWNRFWSSPAAVIEQPSSSLSIVGAEETLSEIRRLVLEDEKAEIIGIYGMGGIGKTTLLKAINNELLRSKGAGRFDLVIWVTVTVYKNLDVRKTQEDIAVPVSKNPDVRKIQEDIAIRLGFSRPGLGQGQTLPEHPTDRVLTLRSALSKKKFLLLLDGLWEKLDLGDVGVPSNSLENRSKIVFTTRSLDVCNQMEARTVKVFHLNPVNSWKLFCKTLGMGEDDNWNSDTKRHAEDVCKKCGGLPITLITVARAMKGTDHPADWKAAVTALKSTPTTLVDMEGEVLNLLKFSFDRLDDTSAKECLLYCALFPEHHDIEISDLIDYWVSEGLLEGGRYPGSMDYQKVREHGRFAIRKLKNACLLEDGELKGKQVKLHDMVRQMALRITRYEHGGKNENVFLVKSGERTTLVPPAEEWTDARRISLMFNEIDELSEKPSGQKLETLLLNYNPPLGKICDGFFQLMPKLVVLDLSKTIIPLLPREIESLVELRHLDLSHTKLESLPVELGRLKKLRQLRLEKVPELKNIPRDAISSLRLLQLLNMFGSYYKLRRGREEGSSDLVNRQLCLEDLNRMTQLQVLGISTENMTQEDMNALHKSNRLCKSIRFLSLKKVGSKSFDLSACPLKGLEKVSIGDCTDLEELIFKINQPSEVEELKELTLFQLPRASISCTGAIFENLGYLNISKCGALEDITWIGKLPRIETFLLRDCSKVEELIKVGNVDYENDPHFPELKFIYLADLPNLRCICRLPLRFPSLERTIVDYCSELKTLPFGPGSAKNIKQIRGKQEWWNQLNWDHADVQAKFTPYFFPSEQYYDFSKDTMFSMKHVITDEEASGGDKRRR